MRWPLPLVGFDARTFRCNAKEGAEQRVPLSNRKSVGLIGRLPVRHVRAQLGGDERLRRNYGAKRQCLGLQDALKLFNMLPELTWP